jgi:hypothetical protein
MLSASISFIGTQEQAQPFINELLTLEPFLWRNVSIGWNLLTVTQGFGQGEKACTRGVYVNHFNIGAKQTNVTTFSNMFARHADYLAANEWFNGQLVFQRYGTATALSVPPKQRGVYPGREIKLLM